MADLRHNSDIRRLKGVTEKDVRRMVKYHEFYLELQEFAKMDSQAQMTTNLYDRLNAQGARID